jgi:hypothetical protein
MSEAKKNVPSQAEIEFLAYQLFLQRGNEPGSEIDDWLAAEEQLKTRNETETPTTQAGDSLPAALRKSASAG